MNLGGGKVKCLQAQSNKQTLDAARATCDSLVAQIPVPKNAAENEKYRAHYDNFSTCKMKIIHFFLSHRFRGRGLGRSEKE